MGESADEMRVWGTGWGKEEVDGVWGIGEIVPEVAWR